jgi:hypothetical protein
MIIDTLVKTVACGGNLLMNVGPTSRGYIDKRAEDALQVYADWMKYNSRAIYGCTMAEPEFTAPADCRFTQSEDGKRLYVHLYAYPFERLSLPGLLGKVENINSEWHGVALRKRPTTAKGAWGGWDLSKSGMVCSAVCNVVAMIIMQHHNVTKAAYYDAENRGALCGLWDVHMHKQKQFYGFKAFNYLYQAGTEYESKSDCFAVQAMAAADEKKGYLLLTNYTEESTPVTLELTGMPGADMQVYLLDETHALEDVVDSDSFGAADSVKREITMPAMSVALVELLLR